MIKIICTPKMLMLVTLLLFMLQLPATIRYVKPAASGTGDGSSWANASGDLNAMLFASINGDEVWVAAGTYMPTRDAFNNAAPADGRDKTFYIPEGVKLYGGFAGTETLLSQRNIAANITILEGDIGTTGVNTDNCYHVAMAAFSGLPNTNLTVDGFTIRNGNANGTGSITIGGTAMVRNRGGNIQIAGGVATSSATITYNIIQAGASAESGGGISLANAGNNTLNNNTIQQCTANSPGGGGVYIKGGINFLSQNSFNNNVVIGKGGGGACIEQAVSLTTSQNNFTGNNALTGGHAGAIFIYNTLQVMLTDDTFSGNSAQTLGGGILIEDCQTSGLTRVNLINNSTDGDGGGIYLVGTNCTISGMTATGNSSQWYGGGLFAAHACLVYNSSFINNSSQRFAGGLCILNGHGFKVTKNKFIGNTAYYSSAIATNSAGEIDSNLVSLNTSTFGETIYIGGENCIVSANVIKDNTSTRGGGIYIDGQHNTVRFNTIKNNIVTGSYPFGGGIGISVFGSDNSIQFNTISNNTAAGGIGGGIALSGNGLLITNNTITGNTANIGGGIGISDGYGEISNNTIFNNNATGAGGGIGFELSGNINFFNNILWGNRKTGNATIQGADFEDTGDGFTTSTFKNNLLQFNATDYTYTNYGQYDLGLNPTGNIFNTDPKFADINSVSGLDGIDRTSDDGLALTTCSPLINMGDNSLVPAGITTDIIRGARIQLTTVDLGAYEAVSNIAPSVVTNNLSVTAVQSATTQYGNVCNSLIATVNATGASPISGSTTARVWIESTPPPNFVKRHYEITPAANAGTASGRVTLYFTQQDFTDFNASNTIKLPINPADAANNKANLRIEKRSGTSSNGTGLPASYTGSITTIDPSDADIIWNNAAGRWEVSFDVTGFSGFFVKTASGVLPVNWVSFNGSLNANKQAVLNWNVEENHVTGYQVEKSTDGTSFIPVGSLPGLGDGNHTYSFTDPTPLSVRTYYRIKQMDADGRYTYSAIILLQTGTSQTLTLYPNPFIDHVQIQSSKAQTLLLQDISGRVIRSITVRAGTSIINLEQMARGIYVLKPMEGESIKLVKN